MYTYAYGYVGEMGVLVRNFFDNYYAYFLIPHLSLPPLCIWLNEVNTSGRRLGAESGLHMCNIIEVDMAMSIIIIPCIYCSLYRKFFLFFFCKCDVDCGNYDPHTLIHNLYWPI